MFPQLKDAGSKGKGLFAAQLTPKGTPVLQLDYSAMMSINTDWLPKTCYGCLTPKPPYSISNSGQDASTVLKTCAGCETVRFCDRTCQKQAWKDYHKHECQVFREMKANDLAPAAAVRAVMRPILLHDNDKICPAALKELLSLHTAEDTYTAGNKADIEACAKGVQLLTKTKLDYDTTLKLFYVFRINAFAIKYDRDIIGSEVHPLLSRINHSCKPNCVTSTDVANDFPRDTLLRVGRGGLMSYKQVIAAKILRQEKRSQLTTWEEKEARLTSEEQSSTEFGSSIVNAKPAVSKRHNRQMAIRTL